MGLTTIPEKTEESIGIVKQDALPYIDPNTQVSAAQYERLKDAVIANASAIGLGDGSTSGSIEARLANLTNPSLQVAYEAGNSIDTTGGPPVLFKNASDSLSFDGSTIDAGLSLTFSVTETPRVTVDTAALTSTLPLRFPDGTAAAPSIGPASDGATGLYSAGANALGIATGGASRVIIANAGITASVPLFAPDGSPAAPAIALSSYPTTGLFLAGADALGLAAAGTTCVTVTNASVKVTVPIRSADGTAVAPAIGPNSDPDTGLYSVGANQLGVAAGGALRLTVDTAALTGTVPFRAPSGTESAPGYAFGGKADSGLYLIGGGTGIGLSLGGTTQVVVTSAAVASALPYLAPDGTAAAPSFSWDDQPDLGFYLSGANSLGIATAGVLRLSVGTASLVSTIPVYAPAGTAAAPAYTWSADTDTGLYSVGANQLGMTTGGVLRLTVSTAALTSTLPLLGPAGSVGAPSYAWSGDSDTGLYSYGANQLGIAAAGIAVGYFSSLGGTTSHLKLLNGNITSGTAPVANALYTKNIPKSWLKAYYTSIDDEFGIASITSSGTPASAIVTWDTAANGAYQQAIVSSAPGSTATTAKFHTVDNYATNSCTVRAWVWSGSAIVQTAILGDWSLIRFAET